MRRQRIGIMGGTFDPIHYGHLVVAEEAYFSLRLSEVIFVPTGLPPHKREMDISPAEDRHTMTLLATLDNPHFVLSRVEIDREAASHTVTTLREMRHWFPPDSVTFFFITGMDAVLDIQTWKEPYALTELCTLVAAGRPGYNRAELDKLPERIRQSIFPLEIPLLAISSTEIRRRVESGRSIRYLVPWSVEHYIYKKGLYFRSGR
ncbi:MAG: nicotinate-nucleotide adenylyltransferase [Synergistales bacterium]|nr:nicotinate-nucleotide adenylyltransferase [Synergistales bacterium]